MKGKNYGNMSHGNGKAKRHHGHGTVRTSGQRGQTIHEPYGKDSSSYCSSVKKERHGNLTGDAGNLDHSLKGTSARQRT